MVLSVARLVPDKDHDTLLAAFSRLAGQHPGAELWLVGNGPRRESLEKQARDLGLAGQVKFLPATHDIRQLYHQAGYFRAELGGRGPPQRDPGGHGRGPAGGGHPGGGTPRGGGAGGHGFAGEPRGRCRPGRDPWHAS